LTRPLPTLSIADSAAVRLDDRLRDSRCRCRRPCGRGRPPITPFPLSFWRVGRPHPGHAGTSGLQPRLYTSWHRDPV